MGLGLVYLYSRHRRAKRRLRELEDELSTEVCENCGYPLHKHADDAQRTCPKY